MWKHFLGQLQLQLAPRRSGLVRKRDFRHVLAGCDVKPVGQTKLVFVHQAIIPTSGLIVCCVGKERADRIGDIAFDHLPRANLVYDIVEGRLSDFSQHCKLLLGGKEGGSCAQQRQDTENALGHGDQIVGSADALRRNNVLHHVTELIHGGGVRATACRLVVGRLNALAPQRHNRLGHTRALPCLVSHLCQCHLRVITFSHKGMLVICIRIHSIHTIESRVTIHNRNHAVEIK
jgi:hypothetical protein